MGARFWLTLLPTVCCLSGLLVSTLKTPTHLPQMKYSSFSYLHIFPSTAWHAAMVLELSKCHPYPLPQQHCLHPCFALWESNKWCWLPPIYNLKRCNSSWGVGSWTAPQFGPRHPVWPISRLFWSKTTQVRFYTPTNYLYLPTISGWYSELNFSTVPCNLNYSFQNKLINKGSRSLALDWSTPCKRIISLVSTSAIFLPCKAISTVAKTNSWNSLTSFPIWLQKPHAQQEVYDGPQLKRVIAWKGVYFSRSVHGTWTVPYHTTPLSKCSSGVLV